MSPKFAAGAADPTIEALIPHREGMLLVERILMISERSAAAEAVVNEGWPTARPQGVDALVLIELVAQTAGLSVGWKVKRGGTQGSVQQGRGWMVGIKRASFSVDPIAIGTRLVIETDIAFEFEQLTEISGVIRADGVMLAKVRLQVVHQMPDEAD
jgi:predicted hotdog family 3-hydroxylacyl-ACP dehydratase